MRGITVVRMPFSSSEQVKDKVLSAWKPASVRPLIALTHSSFSSANAVREARIRKADPARAARKAVAVRCFFPVFMWKHLLDDFYDSVV